MRPGMTSEAVGGAAIRELRCPVFEADAADGTWTLRE